MKKLTLAALIALLTFAHCSKQRSGHLQKPVPFTDSTQALIGAAHTYFDSLPPTDSSATDELPYSPATLHKTPLWGQAQVQRFSFGKGVILPVYINEPLSIQVAGQQLSASRITWLLLYPDSAARWHAQLITRIPTDNLPGRFQGTIRIDDWQGHFIKGYLYQPDSILTLTQRTLYKKPNGPSHTTGTLYADVNETCTETDWYACGSVGDGPIDCAYVYTEEDCASTNGGGPIGNDGSPSSSDYTSIGGGSGASTGSSASTIDIKTDTSITAHPIVQCVYAHLMSPLLTYGLKSILSAFDDNNQYNITFTVVPDLGTDGQTHYQGGADWTIQLNGSEADDSTYSRIYLAATMIHEAFHAKLRQKAVATFGQAAINQWPTPIDDMTLNQLASYFEAESKSANIWESVEHDWMVDNITDMATALQQFVQTFYPSTYAQVGSALTPYVDLCYMGLQTSTIYQEQVIDTGQQSAVESYWGKLNEGGKCSN
jgi:hypothetical protein